jgi:hypothetical protein
MHLPLRSQMRDVVSTIGTTDRPEKHRIDLEALQAPIILDSVKFADNACGEAVEKWLLERAELSRRESRRRRYGALRFLRSHSSLKRIRGCSFARIDGTQGVGIYVNNGVAHTGNLQRCASVHACPVCAPKVRQERAREIEVGLAVHVAMGGGVEFVTLTLRHHQAERLAPLLGLVADGFRTILSGDAWVLHRAAAGVVGTIRTLEVTHGANGWHPHLHVLVLTDRPLDDASRDALADYMWTRWSGYLERRGHHGTTREHGLVAVPVVAPADVARYMSKVYDSLHHEMTGGDLKDGGRSGRNPFRILGDLVEAGRVDASTGEVNRDALLWREYELATKGRQFLTWSMGLKARLGVNELSDDQLVDEAVGGELVGVVSGWALTVMRLDPRRWAELLDAAERHGEAGVYGYLDALPPPPPR